MNGEQAQRFQQLLEEACDHFVEGGGTVVNNFFGRENRKCPMSCLFGEVGVNDMAKEASSLLDTPVSTDDIWSFIRSFDGKEALIVNSTNVSAVLIGRQLRAKYIGIPQ